MTEKTIEEKQLERIKLYREYEGGMGIGEVNGIKNVNTMQWRDFKDISILYGNNEGAAFTAVVQAWLSLPENRAKIVAMRKAREEERASKTAANKDLVLEDE